MRTSFWVTWLALLGVPLVRAQSAQPEPLFSASIAQPCAENCSGLSLVQLDGQRVVALWPAETRDFYAHAIDVQAGILLGNPLELGPLLSADEAAVELRSLRALALSDGDLALFVTLSLFGEALASRSPARALAQDYFAPAQIDRPWVRSPERFEESKLWCGQRRFDELHEGLLRCRERFAPRTHTGAVWQ